VRDHGSVSVRTAGGSAWTGDAAIVTVPVPVLQSGRIRFSPPLTPELLDALAGLKVGQVEKVALAFDERWWPTDRNGYLRVRGADRLDVSEWLDVTDVIGRAVIVGLLVGPWMAATWAAHDDRGVADAVTSMLVAATGV
jgi:monoamine oxidase